jgi:type I restriction enzyme, S subunit
MSLVLNSNYGLHSLLAIQTGALHPHLNCGDVKDVRIPVPPKFEQFQIAAFLERETAKIDALVAEQQRLIELLKEKRQAVIAKAVTKGLNADAPMKSSGISWLGDIPTHWRISRIKYHCSVNGRIGFRGYRTEDQVDKGDGAIVLGATHINSLGEIDLEDPVFISWEKYYESPEIAVRPTDILVVQRGSTSGKVGFVGADYGPATINPSLVLLKEFTCSSRLAFFYLTSAAVQGQFASLLGNTAIPMLSQEQISEIAFCLPPQGEQAEIVAFLELQTTTLDALTAEAQRAIDLLQERRTALISAAVIGQIDVRGLVRSVAA